MGARDRPHPGHQGALADTTHGEPGSIAAKRRTRDPSPVVVATASGAVEYAAVGAGPAVLVVHGVPGGYDQGLIIAGLFEGEPYRFVALSRPGYLGTPLATGETPAAQADAYAALLDNLGIRRAAIIAFSGGGPSTLQFVLRHPDRCWAMITVAALTMRRPIAGSLTAALARWLPLSDRGRWPIAKLPMAIPDRVARALGIHPVWLAMQGNAFEAPVRASGIRNDLAQFDAMVPYPLEQITVPTLVIHGLEDPVVPIAHAELAAATIPGARSVRLRGARHVLFTRPDVRAAMVGFLAEYAALPPR
jgi:pimeloyl-ACP methyl ester carboxylesterase